MYYIKCVLQSLSLFAHRIQSHSAVCLRSENYFIDEFDDEHMISLN